MSFLKKHWIWLLAIFVLATAYVYYDTNQPPKATADDFEKVVISVPLTYDVIPCDKYCDDYIEFEHKNTVFNFPQSNPFYQTFEETLNQKGFLTLWYNTSADNDIYQVALNRAVVIPFEKLHHVQQFDKTFLLLFPLIYLLLLVIRSISKDNN